MMEISVTKNFRIGINTSYDPKIPALVGQVVGRIFDFDRKRWTVPISSIKQLTERMIKEKVWNENDANAMNDLVSEITNYKLADISGVEKAVELPLREYQKETLRFFINRGSALGALDMGTGKTACALSYSYYLKKNGKIEKTLFVVPVAVLWHWKKEATKFFGDKMKLCVVGYEDGKNGKPKRVDKDTRRSQLLSNDYDGCIINYEKLGIILKDPEIRNAWNPAGHKFLVVADEVTRIKNFSAQRCKHLRQLTAENPTKPSNTYRIGLSGRPIENNLFEFYTILDWIWPGCLGSWGKFKDKFLVTDQWGNIIKTKEQQTLKEIGQYIAIKFSRYDVMKELPPLIVNQYDVELSRDEEADYAKISGEIDVAIESLRTSEKREGIMNILALLGMSQMFCDHPILVRQSDSASAKSLNIVCGKSSKLDEFRLVLDEILSRKEKVVVFSKYKNMLDILETDIIRNHTLTKVYKYTGKASATERQSLIDRFNEDSNPAVFLSTDSGSLGVELQAASYIINYDLPWNPAILDQRIARLHRSGQKKPVFVVNMVVRGEDKVEERVLEIIRKKEKIYKDVMGDDLEIALGKVKNTVGNN